MSISQLNVALIIYSVILKLKRKPEQIALKGALYLFCSSLKYYIIIYRVWLKGVARSTCKTPRDALKARLSLRERGVKEAAFPKPLCIIALCVRVD